MNSNGRAPEILAAEHARSLGGSGVATPAQQAPAPISPPPAAPPELPSAAAPAQQPTNPLVQQLETLPDEDLAKEALTRGVKVDKRWGRDRLIAETVQAIQNPPPPAPPAVTPPPAPPSAAS